MKFTLFYKDYSFKPTLSAMKEFKESTGKDLWASLMGYISVYTSCAKSTDKNVADMLILLADVLDFVEAAQLFYCLAKQENNSLTLQEIEDAMFHAGILKNNEAGNKAEPYTIVLYQLALQINEYHNQLHSEKKPKASS